MLFICLSFCKSSFLLVLILKCPRRLQQHARVTTCPLRIPLASSCYREVVVMFQVEYSSEYEYVDCEYEYKYFGDEYN